MSIVFLGIVLLMCMVHAMIAQDVAKVQRITSNVIPLEINVDLDVHFDFKLDRLLKNEDEIRIFSQVDSLAGNEQYDDALSLLNTIKIEQPNIYLIHLYKGLIEVNLGELESAYASFKKSIDYTFDDSIKSVLYYGLGIINMKKDNAVSAYINLKKSYSIDTLNLSTIIILGTVCRKLYKDEEAVYFYKKAVQINPKLNSIWNNLGFVYQKNDKHNEAIEVFNRIIECEPNSPVAYSNRSYSKLQLGQIKAAAADINKSIDLFDGNAYAYRNRALLYVATNEFENACRDINTAIKLGYLAKYGNDIVFLKEEYCIK